MTTRDPSKTGASRDGSARRGLSLAGAFGRVALAATAALALVTVVAPAAHAATFLYVDRNNSGCSDSGAGSQTAPLCTIKAAASKAVAGTTVVVAAGTYPEYVVVPSSGTSSAPIVFEAAPGALVTVGGQSRGFEISSKSWVTIRGFTVTDTSGAGIYVSGSSNISIANNDVSYAGEPVSGLIARGIYLSGSSNSVVSGNVVHHNTDAGIQLTNATTGVEVVDNVAYSNARGYVRAAPGIEARGTGTSGNTIHNNLTYRNEDTGIQIYSGAERNVVYNNVTHNNGDHGIDVLHSPGHTIVANTVYNSVTSGINVEGTSSGATIANNVSIDNGINSPGTKGNIRVDSNSVTGTTMDYDLVNLRTSGVMLVWNSTSYSSLAAFQIATGRELHGIQADPRWQAPASGDFHLTAGSPAIDSADSGATSQPSTDFDGNPRVDDPATANTGTGPRSYDDRGAYEFQAASSAPTAPSAPQSLSASGGDATVALSWSAPASTGGSAITGYKVYRGTVSGGETLLATLGNVTSYTDSAVTNGTTYYYQVSAVNGVGEGPRSSEVSATPVGAALPSAPQSLSASGGDATVALSWSAPASTGGSAITGYKVYRGTVSGGETLLATLGNVTSYTDSAVTNGTTYYYQVSAVNGVGEGPRSSEVSATPERPVPPSPPQNLSAAPAKGKGVLLSWAAPAAAGTSPITGYKVYRGTAPGTETLRASLGNVLSYKDTSTTRGQTYCYFVTAVSAVGESAPSGEVCAKAS